MKTTRKLGALVAAGVLAISAYGIAFAGTGDSTQGVSPQTFEGNITNSGAFAQDYCDADDAVDTSTATSGDYETVSGVTVTITFDSDTNTVSFVASGGLVTAAFIKGSDAYNLYDYLGDLGHGVASDGNLYAPNGMSHAVICTGPGQESQPPSEEPSFSPTSSELGASDIPSEPDTATSGTASGGPSDTSWLLVAALGVLLASVVVMTPARAKARR